VKQKQRYRHKEKGAGLAARWPEAIARDEVISRAQYVGSGEHKALPIDASYEVEPAAHKRSDASRCDPAITRETAQRALRDAIAAGHVSAEFEGKFPRYVWGRVDGRPHVARLINHEAGHYKAWPISEHELPIDRDGRLAPQGNDHA